MLKPLSHSKTLNFDVSYFFVIKSELIVISIIVFLLFQYIYLFCFPRQVHDFPSMFQTIWVFSLFLVNVINPMFVIL